MPHLAPAWYELGPVAFELLAGEGRLWRQLAAGAEELFVERLLDCLCLHDFGPDFLTNLAHRQGREGFRSLGEVAECLRSQFAGVAPQALGLQSPPDVWYAKQNPREECLL